MCPGELRGELRGGTSVWEMRWVDRGCGCGGRWKSGFKVQSMKNLVVLRQVEFELRDGEEPVINKYRTSGQFAHQSTTVGRIRQGGRKLTRYTELHENAAIPPISQTRLNPFLRFFRSNRPVAL
jgi:hypothetical protein